ncbi:MAG TPA: amidohydrolase [Caulobacteraceae bacterium]|nr:amidohydrolase [Caulobacteraceae bacterium]
MDPQALVREMTTWRRDLHAHPEFGFEETRTAALVARTLRSFGDLEVVEGVGGTGVVASLRGGKSDRAIGLRADMDALRIQEREGRAHVSTNAGVMHACGHDGHTAMLLGAAKLLAAEGGFDGVVRFIFQPAEEWGKGAAAMLGDGLLARFPIEEIYGLHNMPGMAIGHFETRAGPLMSAEDNFEIVLTGRGGHSSRPHEIAEVMVGACAAVTALQTIVARRVDPLETAVVSVTELTTDGARNVLPGEARISGDVRSFSPAVSEAVEAEMRRIAEGVAMAHGCAVTVAYTRSFVPLVNHAGPVRAAIEAAETVFEPGGVKGDRAPITASEDFAQFLLNIAGCFGFIGNGAGSLPLHNAGFDFDDRSLGYGARWFAAVARGRLAPGSA